jgi:hypothetical protein
MSLEKFGLRLRDIDLGSIDAESDHRLDEYFVRTPYVDSAVQGRHTLFLGRKGSGKSALFSQLPRLLDAAATNGQLVIPITPDQYAWARLRDYREQGILSEQAHTNVWKLTLLLEVAAQLATLDRQWSPSAQTAIDTLRGFLDTNYGSTKPGLRKTAASVLKGLKGFNFSAFGFGAGFEREMADQPITPTIVQSLFDVMAPAFKEHGILAALDRLDDSWDGSDEARSLLVGLLKASKEINDRHGWSAKRRGLRVLVFLRSDIYDTLQFDDKDKHRPLEQHITWSFLQLHELVTRRLPDGVEIADLFEAGDMRGSITPFSYIVRRTFLRPREVLQFLDECIQQAGPDAAQISKDNVREAEAKYSRWKVADLKQEYAKVFPGFDQLIECFRQQLHRYDTIPQLEALLETRAPDLVEQTGTRQLLELLVDSSVLGIRLADAGSTRFRSEDPELVLPSSGAVYVHQSLHRGLNIREARKVADDEAMGGSLQDRATIELLSLMMRALPIQDLTFLELNPRPIDVLTNTSFQACAKSLGLALVVDASGTITTTLKRPNTIARARFVNDSALFTQLRNSMSAVLSRLGISRTDYVAAERGAKRSARHR